MVDPQVPGDGAQSVTSRSTRSTSRTFRSKAPVAQSFLTQEQPQVEVGLRTRGEQIQPDVYECVLTVTLTAKVADKTLFLVEASQAGIFTIRGIPAEQLQPVIAINCPTVLFPYIREALADAVRRAGFPPVHLAPINFETLYQQQLAQLQPHRPRGQLIRAGKGTMTYPPPRRRGHGSAGRAASRVAVAGIAPPADFLSTTDAATVLYDAPSAKARPLFVLSRDTPSRSSFRSKLGPKSATSVHDRMDLEEETRDRRSLVVRVPAAESARTRNAAPLSFAADRRVAGARRARSGSTTTSMPAGSRSASRRPDGLVRITQVFASEPAAFA